MKKKISLLILSIILVLIVLGSTSYALFFKQDKLENVESYTSGILDIVVDNSEEGLGEVLTLASSLPLSDSEGKNSKAYKFKITNRGNLTYTFDLKLLSTTIDNAISSNYIKVMVDNNEPVLFSSLTDSIIVSDMILNPGKSKIISIRIWLDESTPNTEIGKTFSAKIVSDGVASEVNARTIVEEIKSMSNGVKEYPSDIAITNEGVFEMEDDLGTSYYYRGNVENNYVYFANYYWRIIRLNGDNTIRMIYDGTTIHKNGDNSIDRVIGISMYNDDGYAGGGPGAVSGSSDNLGYMYGSANETSSAVKTYIDNWYNNNLSNYSNCIADAIYCNDRSLSENTYNAYDRVFNTKIPLLICNQADDKFSVSKTIGNGNLTYPIALITVDELMLMGLSSTNSAEHYLADSNLVFWTMSPSQIYYHSFYHANLERIFLVNTVGQLVDNIQGYDPVGNPRDVRPVISLKADTKFIGNGTIEAPFEVIYN